MSRRKDGLEPGKPIGISIKLTPGETEESDQLEVSGPWGNAVVFLGMLEGAKYQFYVRRIDTLIDRKLAILAPGANERRIVIPDIKVVKH